MESAMEQMKILNLDFVRQFLTKEKHWWKNLSGIYMIRLVYMTERNSEGLWEEAGCEYWEMVQV
jgi:hypothetical protein